jgi:hypothetical protein
VVLPVEPALQGAQARYPVQPLAAPRQVVFPLEPQRLVERSRRLDA